MLAFLWNAVFFVLGIGILIAVHEWGHFWVARRCGIKVQQFNIGFGKPLWSRVDRLGTRFVLAAIPLGGYVRMLDERVDDVSDSERHMAFNNKTVGQKIAVMAAGPLVNLIFAVFAMYLVYLIGVDTVKPIVGDIKQDSIAAVSGLPRNVEIVAIDGKETKDWEAVNYELVSHIGEPEILIAVQAPGTFSSSTYSLRVSEWQFDPGKESALTYLGIEPYRPKITTVIGLVDKNSPAERAGMQVNDKIIEIDGTTIENWEQIVEYVSARPDATIGLMVERDDKPTALMVAVGTHPQDNSRGYLGVLPTAEPWPEEYRFTHKYGIFEAFGEALGKTWRLITLSLEMIGKLLSGDVSLKNLSGPISIAQGAGASAGYGVVYFLGFLALISVNLGIINLLPLPVLDGGHLLYYFIELLRGKPVPEHIQEIGFRIGGVLLLALMAIAIVNDIMRL